MPCVSDHLNAPLFERQLSEVLALKDHVEGKPFNSKHWSGYHPVAYNRAITRERLDKETRDLCAFLTAREALPGGLSGYELELQIWWRDHKKLDAASKAAATAWTFKASSIAALLEIQDPKTQVWYSVVFLSKEKGAVLAGGSSTPVDSAMLPPKIATAIQEHFSRVFNLEHEDWKGPEKSPRAAYVDSLGGRPWKVSE